MNKSTKSNDNTAIEGDVVNDTRQSKRKNVKTYKRSDLPLKQRKFIKEYVKTGNGTQSAIKAGYSETSAHVTASRILRSDKVLSILNDSVEEAEDTIKGLMNDESAAIRLAASREVLDRTIGKPIQRSESVRISITPESMLEST